MTVFADSSAIVKLYADEAGHERIRAVDGALVVSAVARVEVAGSLWRKHRLGELTTEDVAVLLQAFEADWGRVPDEGPDRYAVVGVVTAIIDRATRLVGRHALRAYDAVQLASAMAARDALGESLTFAAFDHDLCDAAVSEGFLLLP